jgi:hypothetical protein
MHARNSWRTVLLKGMLGTVVFAAANVVIYDTSGYFQREHSYDAEVHGFFVRKHVKAVFVGDSHAAQLDNDFLANDVYNVGFGGDSLREVYAKLRYLLSQPNEIDTLFLTADVHMFASGRLQSSNGAFADGYLLRTGSPYGFRHGWLAAAFNTVPLFNDDFVQYLKRRVSHSLKQAPPDESQEDEAGWQRLTQSDRERIARETGDMDHRGIGVHPEPFAWYARIISLARQHGVRVVAVRYPATAEYFESVTPDETAAVDRALAAGDVQEVLDFRYVFTDVTYFKDPDHLSKKGIMALLQRLENRTGRKLRGDAQSDPAPPARPASRRRIVSQLTRDPLTPETSGTPQATVVGLVAGSTVPPTFFFYCCAAHHAVCTI